ncbi:MAG: arsenite efflux MFS transporter ArsK [Pseudomonadota bacterium]
MPEPSERLSIAPIVALGATQIIGYGTLYYAFSILAPDMARDLSWSVEWIFGILSISLLVGGLVAPWFGILIDRYGAGRMMTIGSACVAAALVGCSLAPNKLVFAGTLIVVEVAASLVQYGAAFALLVQLRPQGAQRSITYLTLIGGFASTVFWPITAFLEAYMSWRSTYLIFAALNLLVCLPLHAWLARGLARSRAGITTGAEAVAGRLSAARRPAGFALMILAFSLQSFVASAVLIHMVPMLSELGLTATAAIIATFFGPSQVASRLINMAFGRNLSPVILATIAAALMSGALLVLVFSAPSVTGAMAFAVLFGLGNGLFSIVLGTLPLLLFGSEGYGRLQGRVGSARLIVSAAAPFALAAGMAQIGVVWSLSATMALGAGSVLAFLGIFRLLRMKE